MLLKLSNGQILQCYQSDNPAYGEGCDSVEGYCLFNADGSYEDGGEFDFDSNQIKTYEELYNKLIATMINPNLTYEVVAPTSDCQYEDFKELLEEEFDEDMLDDIKGYFPNEKVQNLIREIKGD